MNNNTSSDILSLNRTDVENRSFAGNAITAFLLLIIMFTSIIGNTAVIFAVIKCNHLKEEISNILTVNLAVTDLGNGIFVMFSALTALLADEWILGSVICDLVCALNYCFMITSMITLCAISVDRFQAVMNPFQYKSRVTKTRLVLVAVFSWFQGVVFSIAPIVMKWVEYDYWEAVCAINWYKEKQQAVYYVIAAFLLCFLIPGLTLIYNYTKMLHTIKNFIQPIPSNYINRSNSNNQEQQKTYNTSSKAIRSLVIVAVAYFVCFTPFSVTKLIKVVSDTNNSVPCYINLLSSLVAYCSSAVNPLIYGIFRSDFRLAYKLLINRIVNQFGFDSLFETIVVSMNG